MGNIFSKQTSVKHRLLELEKKITNFEYNIANTKLSYYSSWIYSGIIIIPLAIFISLFWDIYKWFESGIGLFLVVVLSLVTFLLSYFVLEALRQRRISKMEKTLESMKKERTTLVQLCKNDLEFKTTKNLIDKYESDESVSSYFSQVKPKRKSSMESISDFVLGSDPETSYALICKKCGMHNGLLDRENKNFKVFYCYSCKEKNIRHESKPASPRSTLLDK